MFTRPNDCGSLESEIDPYVPSLLENIDAGKALVRFKKDAIVFAQGDAAEAIYFIQTGQIRIIVTSMTGHKAVLAILNPRGFFGEGCLIGQTVRLGTATAIRSATLFRVERQAMLRALHAQPDLSEKFTVSLLSRSIDLEEGLCKQLFEHSEKRLARVFLKLSRFGLEGTEF